MEYKKGGAEAPLFFDKWIVSRFGLLVDAPFLFRGPQSFTLVFALFATEQVKAVLFILYLIKIAYK